MQLDLRQPIENVQHVIDEVMENELDSGQIDVVFADKTIVMSARQAMLSLYIWKARWSLGMPVESCHVYEMDGMSTGYTSEVMTELFTESLERNPDLEQHDRLLGVGTIVDDFDNFAKRHLPIYYIPLSLIDLLRIAEEPPIKAILDNKILPTDTSEEAEAKIAYASDELTRILTTSEGMSYNPLQPYYQTNSLKTNSMVQLLYCYGPRADIDDHICAHNIAESSFSGLKSVEDFATEYLSTKKAERFKKTTISDTQYFSRCLRLSVARMTKIHKGSCGAPRTVPFTIEKKHAKNFINKIIHVNSKEVILTKDNIKEYCDKQVDMVTVWGCRHRDGVCESCMGLGRNNSASWFPENIDIGIYAVTKTGPPISQLVLSAKHLIKTATILYTLTAIGRKYLQLYREGIYFIKSDAEQFKRCTVRIPRKAIGVVTDLKHGVKLDGSNYSNVDEFSIFMDGKLVDTIDLESDVSLLYLSAYTLGYLQKNYERCSITKDYIEFPLDSYDFKHPFMKYLVTNDDMVAFAKKIEHFFTTDIAQYNTVAALLRDFTTLLYNKASNIHIFFIEVILRGFALQSEYDNRIPVLEDFDDITLAGMHQLSPQLPIAAKLAFERNDAYLAEPETVMIPKGPSQFDPMLGFF